MEKPENNPRYINILSKARELFWKHGLKRVTVEEICREAGVSKMTFYKFFPNKFELAKTVYDKVVDEGYLRFKELMTDISTTPLEKMEQILKMKMDGTNEISREFLADFYINHEMGLADHVEEKTKQLWSLVVDDFKRAQDEGWLRRDFNPEGLFLLMSKLFQIYEDEEAIRLYGSPQELVMEFARFFTYGIMPRSDKQDNAGNITGNPGIKGKSGNID